MSDHAGTALKEWRLRRNLSQLDLAGRADVSTRHLSYVETGRSRPSPEMILRLCEELAVPLRDQNQILLSGGYAPAHPEHSLADPPMADINTAIEAILQAHQPYPALVIDGRWELVTANEAAFLMLDGVAEELLKPPVNVLRLSLDPRGLAPRIVNLAEWRDHLVVRLRRQYDASGDPVIGAMLEEVADGGPVPPASSVSSALVVPLDLRVADDTVLSFVSTTTVFGTPREVTLSELAIEAFYPADEATRKYLNGI